MDEAFWSSVLKRWSDASENVIELKKELAKIKEERALHICFGPSNFGNDTYPSKYTSKGIVEKHVDSATTQDELQDAEIGLGRAKEEYRKLQHELAASSKIITELRLQNQRLADEHNQEIEGLREECRGNDTSKPYRKVQTGDDSAELGTYDIHLVTDLKQQVAFLKKSLEVSTEEQHEMRHELLLTREKLHKAEQNIGTLLASIVKLQVIARYPAYGPSHQGSEKSLHSGSRKSSKKSLVSTRFHLGQIAPTSQSLEPSSLKFPRLPTASFQADDKSLMKSDTPSNTALSPHRQKALSRLPTIVDLPPIKSSDNIFDRPFLKHILGEGVESLIKNFPVGSDIIDKKALMSSYLCPTLDHHPWCPSIPGQHGFIFVSLDKDRDKSSQSPVARNVFVGLPKTQGKQRVFRYLGTYRVAQVDELTTHEWTALFEEIKVLYANLIPTKAHDSRSVDEIMSAYDTGQTHIPCAQLQCIGFDEQFFMALVASKNSA